MVTTPEIAASFDNGMEFFSTFGGNPVACAAGLAVLDVLEEERLQERPCGVGDHLLAGAARADGAAPARSATCGARGCSSASSWCATARRASRRPDEAAYVVNRLRERGILTGTDGPHDNVLKLRPPLVFSERDADLFVATLDDVLAEDAVRPRSP